MEVFFILGITWVFIVGVTLKIALIKTKKKKRVYPQSYFNVKE